jgi:hypothetical protein
MTPGVDTRLRVRSLPLWLAVMSVLVAPAWALTAELGEPDAPSGQRRAAARDSAGSARAALSHLAGWAPSALGGLRADVLGLALRAVDCAVRLGAAVSPPTLTVIDYSRPSTEKRLWVFDLRSRDLLYEELVAHGRGSGEALATHFSNQPDTHRSSLGLFATDATYVGSNGYSLRLDGLEAGFNDRARERAIVMHGAPYVSEEFVRAQGRLGRSWGCPALDDAIARGVIDRIKGGSLLFAYYPDPAWLATSKYLGNCDSPRHAATSID